jgi:hypothetical protein
MKKITLLFVAIMLASCEYNPQPTGQTSTVKLGDYDIKVIDECEYIEYSQGMGESRVYAITHKGNCKFCARRSGKIGQ